jgi:GNAT superfamily N-acetyltransferase
MTTAIAPRPATLADAPAIRALTREAYAKWVPLIGREPRPMVADHARAVREHRIDLVEIEGRLAALVEMIPHPDHLLIENLAVAPRAQGRGLGGSLLAHADQVAAALGLGETRLYTNGAFAANLRFYARRGYCVSREEAFGDGIVVHMSRPVGAAAGDAARGARP